MPEVCRGSDAPRRHTLDRLFRLGKTGASRLSDPQYKGQAQTVREYVVESVVSPETYVVPGFPANTMPTWDGRKLSAGALAKIASYLEQAADESPAGLP